MSYRPIYQSDPSKRSYQGSQMRKIEQSSPPEPEKKKRTGLIIGLIIGAIVLLIIIIIVIILLTRPKSSTPTGCKTNTDCTGGKVCDTQTSSCVVCLSDTQCSGSTPKCQVSTHTCVKCLTNTDCPSGEVCSNGTCVGAPCTTNTDCTNANLPSCVAGQCHQCATDIDCSGNTTYSSQGKDYCDLTGNVCVECNANTDCPSYPDAVCQDNVCCNKSPPTITLINPNTTTNSFISGSYILDQTDAGMKISTKLLAPVSDFTASISGTTMTVASIDIDGGKLAAGQFITGTNVAPGTKILTAAAGGGVGIYTISVSQTVASESMVARAVLYSSPQVTPNGVILLVENDIGVTLFPGEEYSVVLELTLACAVVYSLVEIFTMPIIIAPVPYGGSLAAVADIGSVINGINFDIANGGVPTPPPDPVVDLRYIGVVSTRPNVHPNLAGMVGDKGHTIANLVAAEVGYLVEYVVNVPWASAPAITAVVGETYYIYVYYVRPDGIISGGSETQSATVVP